jgi:outer membrane receptor protein involved in Fe transport
MMRIFASRGRGRRLARLACSIALAAAHPAFAQDAATPADDPAAAPLPVIAVPDAAPAVPVTEDETAPAQLTEIIVTATRREKSARDIPVSIDAFSGDDLERAGAQGAQDALKNAPGVTLASYYSPNNATVMIRGTTTSTSVGPGGMPAGAFFDDIPLASPTLPGGNPNIDVFDLATIEVLKGPQGTLFGGSALAGALRSTPNLPVLGQWKGAAFYQRTDVASSRGDGNDYGVMLNVPLGDTFALRGVGMRRRYPGAIDNLYDGRRDTDRSTLETWRGIALWTPTDALSIQALYHEGKGDVDDGAYTDVADRLERSDESGLSPNDARYRIGQIKGTYAFDPFSVTLSVARVKKDDEIVNAADHLLGGQTILENISTDGRYEADIDANELRFVSNRRSDSEWFLLDQWDWVVGFFDYRADQQALTTIDQLTSLPPQLTAPSLQLVRLDLAAVAKEQAAYFDLTKYIDAFELNLGGRLFRQRFSGDSTTRLVGLPISRADGDSKDPGFNPKLALTWHVTSDLALRAAATKGFRFGGINFNNDADPAVPPFYKTDELWNYELGLRSDWFEHRLRIDLTGFFIDWKRTQITQQTRTGLTMFIDNIGNAQSKGAELQLRALLPARFTVTLTGGYTDSRTASDFDGYSGTVPSGTRLPGTPYLTGSATLGYANAFGPVLFDSNLSASYQGKSYSDLDHSHELDAYVVCGFSAGLQFPNAVGAPSLTLNVANLLNERAATGEFGSNILAKPDYFPLRPRTIALRVGMSF